MKDVPTGFYKIGKSIEPVRREKTLLAQQPMIHLLCYWQDDEDTQERFLHNLFRDQRRRGQWFELEDRHLWSLYWRMRKHRRTDVHEWGIEYGTAFREREWRYTSWIGYQNRYIHLTVKPDNTGGYVMPNHDSYTSMEWHSDGQLENTLRAGSSRHPNDNYCTMCEDSFVNIEDTWQII